MRRLFRRGGRHTEDDISADVSLSDEAAETGMADEFEPFVPVRGGHDAYGYDSYESEDEPTATAYPEPYSDMEEEPRRRRVGVRLPRVSAPRVPGAAAIRWDMLLWVMILILSGIVGTLLVLGEISDDVETWWPVAVIVFAVAWMLGALLRRQVASFLGGATLAGVGLSLIMDAQDIARFEETLLGVALVTVGLGIVMRGFLLRQRSPF